MVKWFVFILLLCIGIATNGQEALEIAPEEEPLIEFEGGPSVTGMQRGKGITFTYERVFQTRIRSEGGYPDIEDGSGTINNNDRLRFAARVPFLLRPRMQIIGGFRYASEFYNFSNGEDRTYALYQNLHEKSLRSIGGTIYLMRLFPANTYFLTRTGLDFNGDYDDRAISLSKYMRLSFAAFFGKKASENFTFAPGFAYSYALGKPSLYPALILNYTINERWGLETILPAQAYLRHNLNPETFFYLGAEISGATYHINMKAPPFSQYDDLELRNSNVLANFSVERLLIPWIWIGATGGIRYNLNFYLAPDNRYNERPRFLDNDLREAFYANVSLFLIPPEDAGDQIRRLLRK